MNRRLDQRTALLGPGINIRLLQRMLAAGAMSLVVLMMAACLGVSSGHSNSAVSGPGTASSANQLSISPTILNFGNTAVGSTQNQTGTLTAGTANVTVSSAGWNGQGYTLSGISFPLSLAAGKSVNYTVSFTPQATGVAPGTISFVSDAPNSPSAQSWTGTGTLAGGHSVALSWGASSSAVTGYNIYRGTAPSGPYARLNPSLLSDSSYVDANVVTGATYYYVATVVDASNVESGYSNQATAVIP